MAWNKETRLTAPKTKFEFFDDFERQKHALSNGPMHKAVRSKVTEFGGEGIHLLQLLERTRLREMQFSRKVWLDLSLLRFLYGRKGENSLLNVEKFRDGSGGRNCVLLSPLKYFVYSTLL